MIGLIRRAGWIDRCRVGFRLRFFLGSLDSKFNSVDVNCAFVVVVVRCCLGNRSVSSAAQRSDYLAGYVRADSDR